MFQKRTYTVFFLKLKSLVILFLLCTFNASAQHSYSINTETKIAYPELRKNFRNPPSESRLRCYWWWLNSMATKESITRDLQEMKVKGYGGASIVDAGSSSYSVARKTEAGPVFMSPAWMELYKHAVKEADRFGIELSVNVQSGWNPGAPSITPEFAMKKIVWSEVDVEGGKALRINLPKPEIKLWYGDILVQAIRKVKGAPLKNDAIQNWDKKSFNKPIGWKGVYPLNELWDDFPDNGEAFAVKSSEIIDLTDHFKNETLEWSAPAGEWTIIRYGYTCTGAMTSTNSDGWSGLSVDHLSAEAFDLFSNTVILPLIKEAQSVGNSVKFLQTDSWEMSVVNWTKNFPADFGELRGYDIRRYMPVLAGRIVDNRLASNRFLHDFRKTVGDLVEKNHYQLFYNLAHKYGMGIHPESGGPHSAPVDALKVMGISDFPQGEFWAMANTHRIKDDERLSVKQSACVAHTNGKRFVAAEGPTSIGPQWERSPKDLKGNIDRVFCSGVNRIVWHTFTSSPIEFGLPGNEYFAGTHLNPNVTWWEKAGDFISYLNRSSYMLQQGLYVADVLYYYGDDVPNFVFLKEELPELKFGYDWDKCSKDVVLNRVTFDGQKIVLPDGMSYRLMMMDPKKGIDLAVLKKLETLVKNGMTLISSRPEVVTGLNDFPQADIEFRAIAAKMWGKTDGKNITQNKYGKGKVVWGKSVNDVLAEMNVNQDFSFASADQNSAFDFIHRTTADQEIYFISNRFSRKEFNDFQYRYITELPDRYEQVEARFRVSGMVPEIWNPITGEITEVPVYKEENGTTIVPLHFEPEGSKFVVFRKAQPQLHITAISKDGKLIFPGATLHANHYPPINLIRKNGTISAEIYQTGNFMLTWSDGTLESVEGKVDINTILPRNKWTMNFLSGRSAPETLEIDALKSWTEFDNEAIKYYSGTVKYSNIFEVSDDEITQNKWILDLGNVQEMASVKVNGQQLQVLWSAPFRFDISNYVKKGENNVEVEVVNMWANRLIGDGKLPPEQRTTKTNINKFEAKDAEKLLRPSGLLSPVFISKFPKLQIKK